MHELCLVWPQPDGSRTWNGVPLDDPAVTNSPSTLAVIDTDVVIGSPVTVTEGGDLLATVAGIQYHVFIAIVSGGASKGTDLVLFGVPTRFGGVPAG